MITTEFTVELVGPSEPPSPDLLALIRLRWEAIVEREFFRLPPPTTIQPRPAMGYGAIIKRDVIT